MRAGVTASHWAHDLGDRAWAVRADGAAAGQGQALHGATRRRSCRTSLHRAHKSESIDGPAREHAGSRAEREKHRSNRRGRTAHTYADGTTNRRWPGIPHIRAR